MSAIAGLLRLDNCPADPNWVSAMLAVMGYRGTAPPWLSTDGVVCIGGLSNVPDPAGQTVAGPAVVADARIDNAPELARALVVDDRGSTLALLSDAYKAWGEDCAQRLLGEFALAIWDQRRQRLVCIRDHFGTRPLFCCNLRGRLFAFASEVKALLTLPDLVARLDETKVADFLAGHVADVQRTFYQDVRRLPPAHTLTVTTTDEELRRFWAPDSSHTVRYSSDAEYAAAFREIFTDAVRCRLQPVAGLGVTLSGGLDSSAVTCMGRYLLRKGSQQLSTFSLLFSDISYGDDRPFIAAVARAGDLQEDYLEVTDRSPLRHLEQVGFHGDAPASSTYDSDSWEMYSRAAASGVSALLDGRDGDVTVCYNFRYLGELARRMRWVNMLREAHGLSWHYFGGKVSSWWLLRHYCLPPLLPSWAQLEQVRRCFRPMVAAQGPHALIAERFAARSGLTTRLESYGRELASLRTHRDVHAYMLTHPMVTHALENTDNLCAAFSIEPRHPFYDKRLVEFCLALPREQLVKNGWNRPILRRALADLLPPEVRRRGDKGGSAAPRRLAHLERPVLEATAHDGEVLGDYLDMGRLRATIRRYLDRGAIADAEAIWPAVSLRQWLHSTASGLAASPSIKLVGPTTQSSPGG